MKMRRWRSSGGSRALQFFGYGLSHYYLNGTHTPGRSDIWEAFQRERPDARAPTGAIGTPDQVRDIICSDWIGRYRIRSSSSNKVATTAMSISANRSSCSRRRSCPRSRRATQDWHARSGRLAAAIDRAHARIPPLPEMASVAEIDAYPDGQTKRRGSARASDGGEHILPSRRRIDRRGRLKPRAPAVEVGIV